MKCKDIRWMLALHGSGELSPEEQETVRTHLAACEKCRKELESISRVPELIQSLHGETWWADVSSSIREHISTRRKKTGRIKEEGITTQMPIWRPARFGSLAAAVMERPIWQRVLASVLALVAIAMTSIFILRPWGGNGITQLALDIAQNNTQVQILLGEGMPETTVEQIDGAAHVKFTTAEVIVSVIVNIENKRVTAIQRQALTFQPPGLPADRPKLTEDEKAEAIAIAEGDHNVQVFLSHGFTLGEPDSTHHVLGDDSRRVAWLSLEGITSDEYSGVIVNLDDYQDVTVMWGAQLPQWWPFNQ